MKLYILCGKSNEILYVNKKIENILNFLRVTNKSYIDHTIYKIKDNFVDKKIGNDELKKYDDDKLKKFCPYNNINNDNFSFVNENIFNKLKENEKQNDMFLYDDYFKNGLFYKNDDLGKSYFIKISEYYSKNENAPGELIKEFEILDEIKNEFKLNKLDFAFESQISNKYFDYFNLRKNFEITNDYVKNKTDFIEGEKKIQIKKMNDEIIELEKKIIEGKISFKENLKNYLRIRDEKIDPPNFFVDEYKIFEYIDQNYILDSVEACEYYLEKKIL